MIRKSVNAEIKGETQRAQSGGGMRREDRPLQTVSWVGLWYFGRGISGEQHG